MNFKELLESLKNNFLEIIGFLLPGFIMYLTISYCVKNDFLIDISKFSKGDSLQAFIIVSFSYAIGYLIYGIGVLKNEIYKSKAYTEKIENKLKSKTFFRISLEKYNKHLELAGLTKLSDPSLRELRSPVMGYLNDLEKNLIYTFMFRSDFSNHLYNICHTVGILGLVNYFLNFLFSFNGVFNVTIEYLIIYMALIVSALLLRKTRNHFYEKAMKTPFNIYNSK